MWDKFKLVRDKFPTAKRRKLVASQEAWLNQEQAETDLSKKVELIRQRVVFLSDAFGLLPPKTDQGSEERR